MTHYTNFLSNLNFLFCNCYSKISASFLILLDFVSSFVLENLGQKLSNNSLGRGGGYSCGYIWLLQLVLKREIMNSSGAKER